LLWWAFKLDELPGAMMPAGHESVPWAQTIAILAIGRLYAMCKTLQQWQSRAGLGHSPRTILEELSRITAADIVLPLADDSRREPRIRCGVRPEREQRILLDPSCVLGR